ncbi:MAG: MBL fold metallo-hydrolase [Dehalococcoidia bacterium]
MNIIPFVHEGLGNSSYLLELGSGCGILVDPDRSFARYKVEADGRGLRLAAALETHVHADFVSGAREAGSLGAELYLPAGGGYAFGHLPAQPGERLLIEGIEVEVLAAPGHTPEHVAYVLRPASGPPLLFTGGSLIVSGAARTDLISPELTDELTRAQFRTLQSAFATLPDDTVLYPTHGGGSFCAAGAGGERVSTLGRERRSNPALAPTDEDAFTAWFPSTFPAAPDYFFRMRAFNQAGPRLRRELPQPRALSVEEVIEQQGTALIVDVRPATAFNQAHIPGSLSNAMRSAYATWLGWLVSPQTPLIFVLGDVPMETAIDESLLVGYEQLVGWLEGGIEAWQAASLAVATTPFVEADEALRWVEDGATVVDVRESNEFAGGHIRQALNVPLGDIADRLNEITRKSPILAYCGHGERSTTATSLLERAGYARLVNLDGGYGAWTAAGLP